MSRTVVAAAILAAVTALSSAILAREQQRGPPQARGPIEGRVNHVRDGDTIEVDGVPVRLQGVAAPERGQPLGREAGRFVRDLVGGRRVRCEPDGTRSRDRVVAVCRVDGRDLGAILVARGLARDCARFSRGRYAALEAAASRSGATIRETYALPRYCQR